MKRTTILSILSVFMFTGVAFAAQPYSTKKGPKLLKAQSPTVIVKDPNHTGNLIVPDKAIPLPKDAPKAAVEAIPELSVVEVQVTTKPTTVSSGVYTPTAKQLRQAKRAKKKLEKLDKNEETANGSKSLVAALLLCFFIGVFGIHRFYMGYYAIGILQLLTLGFFGIWTLIDFILLLVGELQPKNGQFEQSLDDEIDGIF